MKSKADPRLNSADAAFNGGATATGGNGSYCSVGSGNGERLIITNTPQF